MSACAPTGVRNNEARLKHEHTVVFAETCCQAKLLPLTISSSYNNNNSLGMMTKESEICYYSVIIALEFYYYQL